MNNEKEYITVTEDHSLRDFLLGLILVGVSIFVVFQSTTVSMSWYQYRIGSMGMPTGVIILPLLISIGVLFYNTKSLIGKYLFLISIVFIIVTLILSVKIHIQRMDMLSFVIMFGSFFAGSGLLAKTVLKSRKLSVKRQSK